MPSFDIISEVNEVELKNAVDNATRELSTRFDFKGVEASITLKDLTIVLSTASDFQVEQLLTILLKNLAARNIDVNSMEPGSKIVHSGKTFSKDCNFKQGIDQTTAKKMVKIIKDSKLKVQASIQGDKVRVNGKKRDELQATMQLLRSSEIELPLQFENFRD